ncbi:VOC family protein [Devosia sp.]|jgi:catechol 2,3-dioxygenase|uniref:VOC family protein n=1 Tax=Devosia sp. TaxID=1871048 RepID=UPI0037BEB549
MIDVESQTSVRTAPLLPVTTTLGPVRLAVTNREQALAIWHDVVGLDILREDAEKLELGVAGKVLIVLELGARLPVVERTTGLYHVAIHVPTRLDFAHFLVRALQRRVRVSPTDHLVSEAIYLWDFDGNGIEITFETPWRGTLGDPESGNYATTVDGKKHSGREPIDVDGLLAEIKGDVNQVPPRMVPGTRIGHVHVHVNSLEAAMRFYRDGLGFGGLFIIKSFGMGDVTLDYTPHAIAFNIWAGPNAKPAPEGAAGLRWFGVVVPDVKTLNEVRARLTSLGVAVADTNEGLEARDPSNNLVKVSVAA